MVKISVVIKLFVAKEVGGKHSPVCFGPRCPITARKCAFFVQLYPTLVILEPILMVWHKKLKEKTMPFKSENIA